MVFGVGACPGISSFFNAEGWVHPNKGHCFIKPVDCRYSRFRVAEASHVTLFPVQTPADHKDKAHNYRNVLAKINREQP